MKILLSALFLLFSFVEASDQKFYYKNGKKDFLQPIPSFMRSTKEVDFYENEKGVKMGVSNKLLVQFKANVDVKKYLLEYKAEIVKVLGTNLYLLKIDNKANTLEVSNALHQKEDVVFAHPDFLKQRVLR